jgi:hypothetical protein
MTIDSLYFGARAEPRAGFQPEVKKHLFQIRVLAS